jgi:23S rRNA pseudouridine1911/1915/1917 synthase
MCPEPSRTAVAQANSICLQACDRGERLDRLLGSRLGLSRSQVRRLLADGSVSLDGRVRGYADKGLRLPGEGRLEVRPYRAASQQLVLPERVASGAQRLELPDERADGSVRVLARGAGWLAVDKPAGWPVHPLREDETGTVLNALAALHPEIQGVGEEGGLRSGVVHRLDVDTSGVLLFATEQEQWRRLRAAFRAHRVDKQYRALVAGEPQPCSSGEPAAGAFGRALGEWGEPMEFELAVARHRPARVRVIVPGARRRGRGYRVRQRLRVVEHLGQASLIEVRLETGFLHQIRVTLAHLGHAVVGDALYGDSNSLALAADRQLLHAARLRFEEVCAESPDPLDFRDQLQRLRGACRAANGTDRSDAGAAAGESRR